MSRFGEHKRSPECLAKLDIGAAYCVTRVRPGTRGDVALRLVGGECHGMVWYGMVYGHLYIVWRDRLPWTVCRRLSCGRSVTVRLVHVESTHLEHAASADFL